MSAEEPSDHRAEPPVPPPSVLVGPEGTDSERPRKPWWHRRRALAAAGLGVVAAAGVAALLIERQPSNGPAATGAPRVTRQAADSPGRDPYTRSVAAPPPPLSGEPLPAGPVDGGAAGRYAGTEHAVDCDAGQLADLLAAHADRAKAWAETTGVETSALSGYLRGLTPVLLRADTRVTNHGFADGLATTFQSVLQAGSAVLVDDHGVPRARCACGNPLTPPVPDATAPQFDGDSWPGFRTDRVVTVIPAPAALTALTLVDPGNGHWFSRPVGSTGADDRPTPAPTVTPTPAPTVSPAAAPAPTGARRPSGAGATTA